MYYCDAKPDGNFDQFCFVYNIICSVQVRIFIICFSLWSTIYIFLAIYIKSSTVISQFIFTSRFRVNKLITLFWILVVLIAIRALCYTFITIQFYRMYPQVRELIKCDEQVVHYFLRKRDFIWQHKISFGISITFYFLTFGWCLLGSSYDAQVTSIPCFQAKIVLQHQEMLATIYSYLILECIIFILEFIRYQCVLRYDKNEIQFYYQNKDLFNVSDSYTKENVIYHSTINKRNRMRIIYHNRKSKKSVYAQNELMRAQENIFHTPTQQVVFIYY